MLKRLSLATMIITCAVACSPGVCLAAQLTLDDFLSAKSEDLIKYVGETGDAYDTVNLYMMNKGQPLYCKTLSLNVTYDQYWNILQNQVQTDAVGGQDAAAWRMVMLYGLIAAFPCK